MIDWHQIDTVLLDMDGTLLDLHYDNYFWLTHLPKRYAEEKQIPQSVAKAKIDGLIADHDGALNWYCLDFWSDTLGLDISQLKAEVQDRIAFRPHVEPFLQALRDSEKQVILVTNAHRQGLNIKLSITHLDHYLDAIVSSHDYGEPKESQAFWQQLHRHYPFDKAKTLFIDDSIRVLDAAQRFGIAHLMTIVAPDSKKPNRSIEDYPAIDCFSTCLPRTDRSDSD